MRRAIVMLLLFVGACSDKLEDRCAIDGDCFRGEVCNDGFCGDPVLTINDDDADAGFDATMPAPDMTTSTDSGTLDMSGPPDDVGTPIDEGSEDMSTNSTVDSSTGLCRADPFAAMCPDDGNDDFPESIRLDARGCATSGNDLEPGTTQRRDEAFCPREDADKFTSIVVPCDDLTFVVEVTVTPHQACDPGDWDLDVRLQGNDCASSNGMMRCETLPDGSKRAIGIVSPSVSLASLLIEISPVADNLRFDYDLEIEVRQ